MMMYFLLSMILSIMDVTNSQPPIGCFVPGECRESLYVNISVQEDPKSCLDFCKNSEGCNYFSHLKSSGACYAFSNCMILNSESCSDCISGDVTCETLTCDKPGFCLGTLISDSDGIANANECLKLCQQTSECKWFSLNDGFCSLTRDCPSILNCTNCIHGEVVCPVEIEMNHLLVVGGYHAYKGDLRLAQVLDLNNASSNCPNLPNFPASTSGGFGIRRHSGEPMICGGESHSTSCTYFKDGYWITDDAKLLASTLAPAVIDLGSNEFWIVGGETNLTQYYKGGIFTNGPNLPTTFYPTTCGVRINETHFFFSAYNSDLQSLIFDNTTGTFTSVNGGWYSKSSCGLINGGKEVIIAGGYTYEDGHLIPFDESKIFNFETMTWRDGPNLPVGINKATSVPWKDTFLMVGGVRDNIPFYDDLDTVIQYNAQSGYWNVLEPRLQQTCSQPAAIIVSGEEFACK